MPWEVSGEYFESCSCDYLCPCLSTNLAGKPTNGDCTFAMAFHINDGQHDGIRLDGLNFALVGYTPGVMGAGNWTVGVLVDEQANQAQRDALIGIASGQAGGPVSNLASLVGNVAGVEPVAFDFKHDGMTWSVKAGTLLDETIQGQPGANPNEPLFVDNTLHPANSRLALAKANGSHLHALGLNWDDSSGGNNGHFAPFRWSA